jgi:3-hydroxyisobutyrate dehydrogenase
MSQLAPRALAGDFAPGGYAKHLLKDLGLALACAHEMQLDPPGLATAKALYDAVAARGWADCGTQALYRWYDPMPSDRSD